MRSIVAGSTIPTAHAMCPRADRVVQALPHLGLQPLRVVHPAIRAPGDSTTAAATTGPASGPRPASSTPARRVRPRRHAALSKR